MIKYYFYQRRIFLLINALITSYFSFPFINVFSSFYFGKIYITDLAYRETRFSVLFRVVPSTRYTRDVKMSDVELFSCKGSAYIRCYLKVL